MMDIDEHVEVNYHNSISFLIAHLFFKTSDCSDESYFSNTALSDYDPLWRVPVKAVQQQVDIVRQFKMEQILIGERFYPRQFNNFRDNPIRGENPLYEFPIGTKSFYLQARSFNPPKLAGCVRAVFEARSGLVRAL